VRLQRADATPGLVSEHPAMREVLQTLERVAPSDLPVLLQGESGSGKQLVARTLHRLSPRAAGPFVTVECGAVPAALLERELFGHEKDAFAGALQRRPGLLEAADRGVLFLDEVDAIPLAVQVPLLRALESGELVRVGGTRAVRVDVRVVSASPRDLRTEMAEGRFREDLYYRLSGVTLRLPPLRERVVAATNRDLGEAVGSGRFREDLYYRLAVITIDVPSLRARPALTI